MSLFRSCKAAVLTREDRVGFLDCETSAGIVDSSAANNRPSDHRDVMVPSLQGKEDELKRNKWVLTSVISCNKMPQLLQQQAPRRGMYNHSISQCNKKQVRVFNNKASSLTSLLEKKTRLKKKHQ